MNSCAVLKTTAIRRGKPYRKKWRGVLAAAMVLLPFSLRGQLVTVDYTLPITAKEGSDLTRVGNIPLGTPMHLSFTYDLSSGSASSSGGNMHYYFTSSATRATLSIGDFSWEMTPAIQLDVVPNGGYFLDGKMVFGNQASWYASTLPAPSNSFHVVMDLTLLWPSGTFDNLEPVLPDSTPTIVDLAGLVQESDTNRIIFRAVDFPNGPPPLTAVPEPASYGAMGLFMLGALCAGRAWKRRQQKNVPALNM